MSLPPGTQIGPYEIVGPLGAGGMGEVYRARDKRLERVVAIKVLPKEMIADPVRKQRFEREAKTISGLNHPHICTLHDVGNQDGLEYLVMECVEGETLAKRLEKGPLPLEQLMKYGAQIADALDKAHRSGVVHRDLKPGNIMLTASGAKLLDFGLAKPVGLVSGATLTRATTQTTPVTQEGTIVGTFQYMSPEQVEGREVDGRSDIFSLGSVLYEMLTGQRAFPGKSQLSVASAILEKEPAPLSSVKPMTPPALDHVIRRCVAKDPEERWQSAADIKQELLWISQGSGAAATHLQKPSGRASRIKLYALMAGVIVLTVVGAMAYLLLRRGPVAGPVVRATLPLSDITLITLGDQAGAPAISPDGKSMVFVGEKDGRQALFLHAMDGTASTPLPGTDGGKFPFWSSDGQSIGFFAEQQLKRLDIAGGQPTSLASAPDGRGGTWAGDVILFAPYIYDPILRISAGGGKAVPATTLDSTKHSTHRWPNFLPDGKHFLYMAAQHMAGHAETSEIYAGSLDRAEPKLLMPSSGNAFYASGNLVFYRSGSLMAQELDASRLELRGRPKPIADVLWEFGNWGVMASASQNGILLFQNAGTVRYPVLWCDRTGRRLGPASISAGEVQDLRVSPDRTRAAVVNSAGPLAELSVYDLKTGARTRLTSREVTWFVAWSPDGTKLAYSGQKVNRHETEIFVQRADGAGQRQLLLASGNEDHPTDWTRDGRYLVFNRGELGAQRIWVLPIVGDPKPFPLFADASYDHSEGRVSPDGKWIAYMSAEAGPGDLYISSFPSGSGKWQVSSGGIIPSGVWSGDGKELYFLGLDGNLRAASVRTAGDIAQVADVRTLFRSPFVSGRVRAFFDLASNDGQRFIGSAAPDTTTLPLNVMANWTEGLKGK